MKNRDIFDNLHLKDLMDDVDLDILDDVELDPEDKIIYSQEMASRLKESVREEIGKLPIGKILSSILQKEIAKIKQDREMDLASLNVSMKNKMEYVDSKIKALKDELGDSTKKLKEKLVDVKNDVMTINGKQWYQFGGFAPPNPLNHSGEFLTNSGTWDTIAWAAAGGDITIGDPVISGTPGSVLFIDASGNLGEDNSNFFYNNSTDSLFIGVNSGTGKLRLKLDSDDFGLQVDGNTTPYQGEQASYIVNSFTRTIGDNDGNIVNTSMVDISLTNSYAPNIGGEFGISNVGIQSTLLISSPYAGTSVDDFEGNYGGIHTIVRSGTITDTGNMVISNYGLYTAAGSNTEFSGGGTQTENTYGHLISVSGFSLNPAPTNTSYGIHLTIDCSLGDSAEAYGLYINQVTTGGDGDNFAIYSVPDVPSYFRGDISINTSQNDAQFSQIIDSSLRIGHRIQGAVSQVSTYLSIVDSSLNSIFNVAPTLISANSGGADIDFTWNADASASLTLDAGLGAFQFNGSNTRASAASATWNNFNILASTATISGSTNISTSTGFNLVTIARPTLSNASINVASAATVYIANSPLASGGCTISSAYSLWVDDGNVQFDGNLDIGGSTKLNGNFGIGVTPVARSTGWSVTNVTTDKTFDANSTSLDEIADVLGSLITYLLSRGDLSA